MNLDERIKQLLAAVEKDSGYIRELVKIAESRNPRRGGLEGTEAKS